MVVPKVPETFSLKARQALVGLHQLDGTVKELLGLGSKEKI